MTAPPEPPDFKQIAGYSVPVEYVAHVAEQLRQVWNARGAADLETLWRWVRVEDVPEVIRAVKELDQ